MKASEVRSIFLDYFNRQQHSVVSSSSLVPDNDPTLLFTNAGMVQFKDVFLGFDKRDYTRATTSQRCVRAGGKHNDLENVGYTARHHTFFEMLGNFSFGDYFKKDAIHFAWNLLTKEFKLPEEKLWITVFEDDDEAEDIWLNDIGVPKEKVIRIGAKDNFWQMGDTGPCGPCSEIFYDHGPDVAGGPPGSPDEDGDRYIEIWNLVFMQYDRAQDGTLTPLPKPCVDTGMGLERIAAVLQDVHSNYEIDMFVNLINGVAKTLECKDLENKSLRVIADHIRSTSFLILDGVLPSNEGRGYVLRRIIRRAVRHGYQLGCKKPFMHDLVKYLCDEMGEAYPDLIKNKALIEQILERENERFLETLEQGLHLLDKHIASIDTQVINGEVIFKLYDTFGFPVDLTNDVARERSLTLDMEGFDKCMENQRQKARSANSFSGHKQVNVADIQATNFIGFTESNCEASIIAIFKDGEKVDKASAGDNVAVVLDQTTFYAEGGGQVGDKGVITSGNAKLDVVDVQKPNGKVYMHIGVLESGEISVGDKVNAELDKTYRDLVANNHSATHLLHAALIEILGDHVHQKGSLVDSSKLRFDFSHFESINTNQIEQIEQIVNDQIRLNHQVNTQLMNLEDAKKSGAQALFGEKYEDEVRVVEMGPMSMELCGGTHVNRTGDIGLCKISVETGVAAGIRRIEALTSLSANEYVNNQQKTLQSIAELLKTSQDDVLAKVEQLVTKTKELEKQNSALQTKLATSSVDQWLDQAEVINGVNVLTVKVVNVENKVLRQLMDQLKTKLNDAVIFLASDNGNSVPLLVNVADSLTKQYQAGKLLQQVAPLLGGKGGGKPNMAQGGGSDAGQIDEAFKQFKSLI